MVDETATSDMYDKQPIDVKQADEVLKRNQPPAGLYVSMVDEYEPVVTPHKFEGDARQYFNVFVRAAHTTKGGDVVEQGLRFKFSQEIRPATKFGTTLVIEGKDDSASKRYAELTKAYREFAGEEGEPLKDVDQLIDLLKTVPLSFNTMNGDNGLNVTKVFYKKSSSR